MITYPNQKVVTVRKAKSNKENPYTIINKDCAMRAAKVLDAGAYKLWIFFELNANDYTFALSSKYLNDEFGMGRKQYDSAIQKLIDFGYLTHEEGNGYTFSEEPCTKMEQVCTKMVQGPCTKMEQGPQNNHSELEKKEVPCTKREQALYQKDTSLVPKGHNILLQKDTRKITENTLDYNYNTEDEIDRIWAFNQPIQEKKKVYSSNDFSF